MTTFFCLRHLQRKHPTVYREYRDSRGLNDGSQSSIANFFGATTTYGPLSARHQLLSISLVKNLIIDCSLPLSIVENESFQKFVTALDPKFKPPSRTHIALKMLPKLVEDKKKLLVELLQSANYVSCTLDLWSDRNCRAFAAITAHMFVDFQAKSCLLSFREMSGSHTGTKIAEVVESVLKEYSIQSKVEYFVTDNASNMKKAFTLLSSFHSADEDDSIPVDDSELLDDETLWEDVDDLVTDLLLNGEETENADDIRKIDRLPCFGHTLQLVVKDGVDKIGRDSRGIISKCCKLSSTLHQSTLVKEAFEKHFGANRSIPQANATRWSSLFNQLNIVAKLDNSELAAFLAERELGNLLFSAKDHAVLAELVKVLEPFAEATTLCQGDELATIGVIVPSVVSLHKHLKAHVRTVKYNIHLVKALLESLHARFNGLLQLLNILPIPENDEAETQTFGKVMYLVASVLDPVYGFVWLEEDHPGSSDVKDTLRCFITDAILQQASLIDAKHANSAVAVPVPAATVANDNTSATTSVVVTSTTAPTVNSTESDTAPATKKRRSVLFASYEKRREANTPLQSTNLSDSTTRAAVLYYLSIWSQNSKVADPWAVFESDESLQPLTALYERVFCCTASSCPVERVFSHSGLFMRPHRARMGKTLLRQLVFLKCNRHL